jgi:O-succinylbenzoic acid--CoA ligase
VVDISAGFRPEAFAAALATMTGERRYVSLVPTQLIRLLDAGVELTGLDAILLGGGPIPAGLVARAAGVGARVVPTYGMTETCGGCVYGGRAMDRVGLRITDEGLVAITGPVLARGYLGGPEFGGEFVSSDLGRLDDGVLTVLGRADDVVISGGVNVPAQAVEAVLAGDPAVEEAVVVGRDDPQWGQRVVAVLTVRGAGPDQAALRAAVSAHLGAPHAPREFIVLDALPRLPSGKVDRAAIRAKIATEAPGH